VSIPPGHVPVDPLIASRTATAKNFTLGYIPQLVGCPFNFCRSRLRAKFRSVPEGDIAVQTARARPFASCGR
jgi:hypothetical protein